jgi:hypothetical protein
MGIEKNLKFDGLGDIFLLKTGQRSTVLLHGVDNLDAVYADAYSLDIYINTEVNTDLNTIQVSLMDEHKPKNVARQLIHTLKFGDEEYVSYKGQVSAPSLRTALHNYSRTARCRVRVNESLGVVFVRKGDDNSVIEDQLEKMAIGDVSVMPTSMHSSLKRLRSAISNYSAKSGASFKTKLVGLTLHVVRTEPRNPKDRVMSVTQYRTWLTTCMWDIPHPVPVIEGMTLQNMVVIAKRLLGCAVSFRGNAITKNSFAKGIEGGARTVRVNGQVVYSVYCDKFGNADIDAINLILKYHNKTFEDLV